jgi:hypothetical protein
MIEVAANQPCGSIDGILSHRHLCLARRRPIIATEAFHRPTVTRVGRLTGQRRKQRGSHRMPSSRRIAPAIVLVLFWTISSASAGPVQQAAGGAPVPAADQAEAGWSFDDVKDVFEATQFAAITIGIGVAVYWLCLEQIPRARAARIEFDVDVVVVGRTESAWLVEIVALVHNCGVTRASLLDCRFSIAALAPGAAADRAGALLHSPVLTPLFEASWSTSAVLVDAGTRSRVVCAATIPKAVTQVIVTGQMTHPARPGAYTASHVVELKRPAVA